MGVPDRTSLHSAFHFDRPFLAWSVWYRRRDAGEDFSGFSDTAIAFGGGGGIDVRVRRRVAVRAQFDLLASFADIVEGNPRFAIGLVVGLGGS